MPNMPDARCRLVLMTPPAGEANLAARLEAALSGGDVASVILPQFDLDDASFQKAAAALVPIVQAAGAAAVIAGDSRIAPRVGADGIHVDGDLPLLADLLARQGDDMIVGAGGARTRDEALDQGEERPHYLFFGKFGYDNQPQAHPRNLSLGAWWAEMIEIPCIVMGGSALESARAVAETGAEFVALGQAVFAVADPAAAVREANAILDAHASAVGESM